MEDITNQVSGQTECRGVAGGLSFIFFHSAPGNTLGTISIF